MFEVEYIVVLIDFPLLLVGLHLMNVVLETYKSHILHCLLYVFLYSLHISALCVHTLVVHFCTYDMCVFLCGDFLHKFDTLSY